MIGPWIVSCDWGTTSFRLRLVDTATGAVAGELRTADGARALAAPGLTAEARAGAYRDCLSRRLAELTARLDRPLDGVPVLISGMASASIGWRELPYAPLPVGVDGADFVWARLPEAAQPVFLISGLRTGTDVLRGEEAEIVGLLQAPDFAAYRERALLLLPGTHSKHVRVEAGRIIDFATYLTGELFALLTEHSVLAHSVRADDDGADDAFDAGLADARRLPLTHALFRVRARQLLDGTPAAQNRAYLDGLLIGSEMQGLAAALPPDCPVLLSAGDRLAARYTRALAALSIPCRIAPPELADRAASLGHLALARRIPGS